MYRPEKEPGPYASTQKAERTPDEPTKIDPRLIRLAKETANLPSKTVLAKREVKNGMDPRYIAMKYDLDVERFVAACEAWKARQPSDR